MVWLGAGCPTTDPNQIGSIGWGYLSNPTIANTPNPHHTTQFTFPMDYPSKPPSVYFLQPTPRHEHVYTNGDICLNLLGRDWRPNMTASTLALSILSMLSSAKEKKIPQDNHVRK